ncbi:hypothetical protein HPB50_009264 [Hyalomma asiaticum]|uniref:Uncharacterized protein n=1 Tax=Hyalomma asiaticum TaxID=266040 RepID=A0ACB7T6Y3_HYAAI|nr:hypothetical protein HPB50_009264 [Hyalomma asiaticum]
MALKGSRYVLSKLHLFENVARSATVPCRSALQRRAASGKADSSDTEDYDKPVVYSTSKAAQWKAAQTFRTPTTDVPAAQRWSVLLSISVFLIYFLVLREENDLDEHLSRPITDTVPDLEKIYGKPPPLPKEWVPPAWRD